MDKVALETKMAAEPQKSPKPATRATYIPNTLCLESERNVGTDRKPVNIPAWSRRGNPSLKSPRSTASLHILAWHGGIVAILPSLWSTLLCRVDGHLHPFRAVIRTIRSCCCEWG